MPRFGLRERGGRGASREGGRSVQGRGGILFSARSVQAAAPATAPAERARRAAEGTPALGEMQQMRAIQVAGPEPSVLWEGVPGALDSARATNFISAAAGELGGGRGAEGLEKGL